MVTRLTNVCKMLLCRTGHLHGIALFHSHSYNYHNTYMSLPSHNQNYIIFIVIFLFFLLLFLIIIIIKYYHHNVSENNCSKNSDLFYKCKNKERNKTNRKLRNIFILFHENPKGMFFHTGPLFFNIQKFGVSTIWSHILDYDKDDVLLVKTEKEFVFFLLCFSCSYEGTGRSLSLKLLQQLRRQNATFGSGSSTEAKATNATATNSAAGKCYFSFFSSAVYAIIFAYRYFCDFGLGAEIREGLISWFLSWFHYYE